MTLGGKWRFDYAYTAWQHGDAGTLDVKMKIVYDRQTDFCPYFAAELLDATVPTSIAPSISCS